MAPSPPNLDGTAGSYVAAPRVGAGQDVASESFGKGSLPEPGWMRENAKALRAASRLEKSVPTIAPLIAAKAWAEKGRAWPTGEG